MSKKLRIREAILVEGRYDVNTVRQLVDTVVLETGGFRIFNDYDQLQLIRRIASARGLIILTDSDGAGFVIRNYLKGALQKEQIKQAYIPDISGKEARKRKNSKEGKLGVEGMRPDVLRKALLDAGATILDGEKKDSGLKTWISKSDFVSYGLSGGKDSAERRKKLLNQLALPEHMTANALLEYINAVSDRETLENLLKNL
ncbi:DUF4093 domain-containing protein [Butyricicoccus sp. 1XD8-22]|nr:DUF4093 domain-containing protein [Butyricicoccus sp. 1XD8-22]